MIKECYVKLNNDVVTVVNFDGIDIQFPAIRKDVKTVYVDKTDGKYKIVDKKEYENSLKETENTKIAVKNKEIKKKAITKEC